MRVESWRPAADSVYLLPHYEKWNMGAFDVILGIVGKLSKEGCTKVV
jgi:hypothetical protein